jgi:hypothetical protein
MIHYLIILPIKPNNGTDRFVRITINGGSRVIMLKRMAVLIVGVIFALVSLPAMSDWGYQWGVKKDKYGKCHVIPLRPIELEKGGVVTEKVAAGPFATRDEAIRVANEECPSLPTPEPVQWGVIKHKNGNCNVVPMRERTPDTVAGPFAKKNEAEKAMREICPPLPATAYQWAFNKDLKGNCHVIPLRAVEPGKGVVIPPNAVGPYATKEEAIKAANEKCSSLPTPEPLQWYVVIKHSKCKLVQMTRRTPDTVAGPFATKNEAQNAMSETCPSAGKKR